MPKKIDQNAALEFLNEEDESLDQSANDVVSSVTKRNIENQVSLLPIDQVDDYPNNPMKVKDDDDMKRLMASIEKSGGINTESVIVRQKPNGRFELLAGHRRKFALIHLNRNLIRAEIRNVDDEEAEEIVIDSNMQHRTSLEESEIIRQLYRLYELRRKRAGRKKQGSEEEVGSTKNIIADEIKMSPSKIQMYIKLHDLSKEYIQAIDQKEITKNAAYHIAFLDPESQNLVLDTAGDFSVITLDKAKEIHKAYEKKELNQKKIINIFGKESKADNSDKTSEIWRQIEKELPKKMSKANAYKYILDVLRKAKAQNLIN